MPFVKGQSGNPSGRPIGSRNRFTREMVEALEQRGLPLLDAIVNHAHAANPAAMRLCLDRLAPMGKHRPSSINLPPVDTPQYAVSALTEIQRALGAGEITTDEAARLVDFVGRAARVLASQAGAEIDVAERVARCEDALLLLLNGDEPAAAQESMPPEAVHGSPPQARAEPAIDNNNAETMTAAPAQATRSVPPAPAQRPPTTENSESPVVAAALDKAVQAAVADVRPRRRGVRDRLMSSVSPKALMISTVPEKTTSALALPMPLASAA